MSDNTIAFIGAGNMASAIFGGLIEKGFAADKLWATTSRDSSLAGPAALGMHVTTDNSLAIANADIVVLAVKPQKLKDVLLPLQAVFAERRPLIISVAVGVEISSIERWLGHSHAIVRCMPNTPSLVQKGAAGLFANALVSDEQKRFSSEIFQAVGLSLWVDKEKQIDTVAAVSGSGPAYFFLLIEAMTNAGVNLGLERNVAEQLTLQTAIGAAQMAIASDVDAAELRRRVTSPAGTTEAAIKSFESNNFAANVDTALHAATQRAAELAKLLT